MKSRKWELGIRVVPCLLAVGLLDTAAVPQQQRKPDTPQQAAAKVLAAVAAKDPAALEELAKRSEPDPWLVAAELCHRKQHDAAAALATATPSPFLAGLDAYVAGRRDQPPDDVGHAAYGKIAALGASRDPESWAAAVPGADVPLDTVFRVYGAFRHGAILAQARQFDPAAVRLETAGAAAKKLGWMRMAAASFQMRLRVSAPLNDPRGALASARELVGIMRKLKDRRGEADMLGRVAIIAGFVGRHEERLEAALAGAALAEELGDERLRIQCLTLAGDAQLALEKYAEAVQSYEAVTPSYEMHGPPRGLAAVSINKGLALLRLRRYDESRVALEKGIAAAERAGDRRFLGNGLGNLVLLYRELDDDKAQLPLLERLHEMRHGSPGQRLHRMARLAEVRSRLGQVDAAYAMAMDVAERAKKMGEVQTEVSALLIVAGIRTTRGQEASALEPLRRALALVAKGPARDMEGRVHSRLGPAYLAGGAYVQAQASMRKALKIAEAADDKRGVALELGNLGVYFTRTQQFAAALDHHERALALKREVGDRIGTAATLHNIGSIYSQIGMFERAADYCRQARAAAKEAGSAQWQAGATFTLAGALSGLGDTHGARALYEEAATLLEELGRPSDVAGAIYNIGNTWAHEEAYAKAREHYERAAALYAEHGQPEEALNARLAAAAARFNLGDVDDALAIASKGYEESSGLDPYLRRGVARAYAGLLCERGEDERVLDVLADLVPGVGAAAAGLGAEEGASARAQTSGVLELGALAAARLGRADTLLEYLERDRAGGLLESIGGSAARRLAKLPDELARAEAQASEKLAVARERYEEARNRKTRRARAEELRAAMDELREVAGRVQREAKQQAGLFYPEPATPAAVRDALAEGDVLVVYGFCVEELVALVVTPESMRVVRLGEAAPARAACEALDLSDPDASGGKALARLGELLVKPLRLPATTVRVIVAPDGPLNYVPFGLLLDAPVAFTPSASTHVLFHDRAAPGATRVLGLGDPDYGAEPVRGPVSRGRRLVPLPGTRKEVESVADVRLLGKEASEPSLRAAVGREARWRAVHLACHGLVDAERPTLSALALTRSTESDGFLTVIEILGLDVPADLVALSACESARGKVYDGDGIVGLTRAFMHAGAPRVLCSLWKVDDEATQALMIRFYELWNPKEGRGLGAAEALKEAQAHVRSREKWKHPYYWAAWVLWGLPD